MTIQIVLYQGKEHIYFVDETREAVRYIKLQLTAEKWFYGQP